MNDIDPGLLENYRRRTGGWTTDVTSPFDWPDYDFAALYSLEMQELSAQASIMSIAFAHPIWWVSKLSTEKTTRKNWPLEGFNFKLKDLSEQANAKWFVNMLDKWGNSQKWHKDGKGVRLGPSRQASWYNEEHWKKVWKQIMESRVEFKKGNRLILSDRKPALSVDGFSNDDTVRQLWQAYDSNMNAFHSKNKRFLDFHNDIKEVEGEACWSATVDVGAGLASSFLSIMNFDSSDELNPQDNDYTILIEGPLESLHSAINNRFSVVIRMKSDNSEIQNQQVKEIQARFASARGNLRPKRVIGHNNPTVWRKV